MSLLRTATLEMPRQDWKRRYNKAIADLEHLVKPPLGFNYYISREELFRLACRYIEFLENVIDGEIHLDTNDNLHIIFVLWMER